METNYTNRITSTLTEVSICNKALRYLGSAEIVSLNQDSREANLCLQSYSESRDELLTMHNWIFASRHIKLARIIPSEKEDLERPSDMFYTYQLPSNYLSIQKVFPKTHFILGSKRKLYANVHPISALLTISITDTSVYPPLFVEALARRISASLAISLLNNSRLEQLMMQRFMESFELACLTDSNQSISKLVLEEDSWIGAR